MGFVVKQKVEHNKHGELGGFYVRIEMYRFDVIDGKLHITSSAYTDKEGAQKSHSKYKGEVSSDGSFLIGQIKYNNEEVDLNDFNYFEFPLTKDVTVVEDIVEEEEVTVTEPYFDFDETGDVVEKTGERTVIKTVKVGERNVEKVEINLSPVYDNLFSYAYTLLKQEYANKFGEENIEDL